MGSYAELSKRPDGAFTKLMEWQMSGGEKRTVEGSGHHEMAVDAEGKGSPSEREEIEHLLGSEEEADPEDGVDEQGLKGRKGRQEKTEKVDHPAGKKDK